MIAVSRLVASTVGEHASDVGATQGSGSTAGAAWSLAGLVDAVIRGQESFLAVVIEDAIRGIPLAVTK